MGTTMSYALSDIRSEVTDTYETVSDGMVRAARWIANGGSIPYDSISDPEDEELVAPT